MILSGIGPTQLVAGLLIFVRALGIFTSAPIFGHTHLPAQLKVGLALMITLVLLPVVPAPDPRVAENVLTLACAAAREVVVGLVIGYVSVLLFVAIQLAGEAIDIQVGFGLANIADPLLGTQASLVGQFQYMLATLIFLALNGHHLVLGALVKSFELVPLTGMAIQPLLGTRLLDILSQIFLIGLRIGGPVMLAVFLTDLALGLLGRTLPQMNLLMVGFPIKIFVGLAMLLITISSFYTLSQGLFQTMYRDIVGILQAM